MPLAKFSFLIATVLLTGTVAASAAAADFSILTPEGFFQTVNRIAEKSGPKIGVIIQEDYPTLPADVTELVAHQYPKLYADIYNLLNTQYPQLYSEAADYTFTHSVLTYRAFQQDLIGRKSELAAGKANPGDLFWGRIEQQPPLKIEVMSYLSQKHPELPLLILSRVDHEYPMLKVDLFRLVVTRYPGLIWESGKIWTLETLSEMRR
jgi:hypothetical protein